MLLFELRSFARCSMRVFMSVGIDIRGDPASLVIAVARRGMSWCGVVAARVAAYNSRSIASIASNSLPREDAPSFSSRICRASGPGLVLAHGVHYEVAGYLVSTMCFQRP